MRVKTLIVILLIVFLLIIPITLTTVFVVGLAGNKGLTNESSAVVEQFMLYDNKFFAVSADNYISLGNKQIKIPMYMDHLCDVETCSEDAIILSSRINKNGKWMHVIFEMSYDDNNPRIIDEITEERYDCEYQVRASNKQFEICGGEKVIRPYHGRYKTLNVTCVNTDKTNTIDFNTLNSCEELHSISGLKEDFFFAGIIEKDGKVYVIGSLDLCSSGLAHPELIIAFEYNFNSNSLTYYSSVYYVDEGTAHYYI